MRVSATPNQLTWPGEIAESIARKKITKENPVLFPGNSIIFFLFSKKICLLKRNFCFPIFGDKMASHRHNYSIVFMVTAVLLLGTFMLYSVTVNIERDEISLRRKSNARIKAEKFIDFGKKSQVDQGFNPNLQSREPVPDFDDSNNGQMTKTTEIYKPLERVLRTCDDHLERNIHFADRKFWHSIKPITMFEKKKEWTNFITNEIPNNFREYSKYGYNGRGIVYTASGRTIKRAITSISILRNVHGCNLPVQIWHIDGELNEQQQALASSLKNVEIKDILVEQQKYPELADFKIRHSYGSSRNYQIKSLVLILTEFEEILYLDSDNMPLKNPEFLFETDEYEQTGAIFWPDFWKFPLDNPLWQITNQQCEDEWEQESGQLVIHKGKTFKALLLSMFFQRDHEFYFKVILGDKDTFRFAWKITNTPYYMIERPVALGGRIRQGRFCGHTMLQFDPLGDLLFAHTTAMKSTNSIRLGNTWETLQFFDRIPPEEVTGELLKEETNNRLYLVGYPITIEYTGGEDRTSELGGMGPETFANPCLNFAVVNTTVKTTADVVEKLGESRAVDSYRIITESFAAHDGGRLRWFEKAYYEYGGVGSRSDATCGNGFVGNGQCPNEDECCSPYGWCGLSVDHCGVGCAGGPCFSKRTLPTNPDKDFAFCGGGEVGFGLCRNPNSDCCSRFGFCSGSKEHCAADVCLSGPCLVNPKPEKDVEPEEALDQDVDTETSSPF